MPGSNCELLAHNNDILGDAVTDADGVAKFPAPLLHGEGPLEPASLDAFGTDGDFATLDLNVAAFDLSDRGVSGAPDPGPLDAFVWLDRGIYRPGETVQVMALLRDNAGLPADIPARITVKRPNGQVFLRATPPRTAEASLHLPVTLSAGAPAGTWTVEVQADPAGPAIGKAEFRVDAFVPDRMAVDLGKLPDAIHPGTPAEIPLTARFLYGAPGAGLSGKGSYTLTPDPAPFPDYTAYHFGLVDEAYAPQTQETDLPETDAHGATTLHAEARPGAGHDAAAEGRSILLEVDDPSGHGSKATASTCRCAGTAPLIGIKPLFTDDAVDAGAEAAFDIVAVTPDGQPHGAAGATAAGARAAGLAAGGARERGALRDGVARRTAGNQRSSDFCQCAVACSPSRWISAATGSKWRKPGGMAATSYRFRSGWAGSDSPDVPDRVDVSAERRSVPVGRGGEDPHRPAVRRRSDAAGADRPRAQPAHPHGAGRRDRCGRAGRNRWGPAPTWRCTCSAPTATPGAGRIAASG